MKKYVNRSQEMRTLYFTDGTAIFMFRGQTVETNKEVSHVPDGVKVTEVETKSSTTSRKRSSSKASTETKETD